MLEFLGIASGVVFLAGCAPYVRDIFRKTTVPECAPWFIWTMLGIISFFAQSAEGATWSLWLTVAFILGDFIIFALSIKYGIGGFRKRDIIALVASGIGLYLWYLTQHAYISLYITILIDAVGYQLIYIKVFESPKSETISAWVCFAMAGLLGALSVGKLDPILVSYPLFVFAANTSVVGLILLRRSKKTK